MAQGRDGGGHETDDDQGDEEEDDLPRDLLDGKDGADALFPDEAPREEAHNDGDEEYDDGVG